MKTLNVLLVLLLSFSASLCQSRCPAGKKLTQVVKPTSNGCGPGSGNPSGHINKKLGIAFLEKFQTCCNAHDVCYGTCGSIKDRCETGFLNCMTGKCNELDFFFKQIWCKTQAKAVHTLVSNSGSMFFINEQYSKCKCL